MPSKAAREVKGGEKVGITPVYVLAENQLVHSIESSIIEGTVFAVSQKDEKCGDF